MLEQRLFEIAKTTLSVNLGLKPHESLLIVHDEPMKVIGKAFFEAGRVLGAESILLMIIPRAAHGSEPPPQVAEIMRRVDVVLAPTTMSISHTEARRTASAAGVRIATMPGITEEMMLRTLGIDYVPVAKTSRQLAALLSQATRARAVTPMGTDLSFSLDTRQGRADTGLVDFAGAFSNLPAGEAYIAPLEGTAQGVIVVDGSMAGPLGNPVTITVRDGQAVQITGDERAEELAKVLAPYGTAGHNLAEFGLGTNPAATFGGSVLEEEKVLGTIHFAFGDNMTMGGKVAVPIHIDGIVTGATVWLDDTVILRNGKLVDPLPEKL